MNQIFHLRIKITDHFDELINQIDIKTETLLENKIYPEETRQNLNEIREKQIKKIKEIKEINLNHLPSNIDEEKFKQKCSHILEDASLNHSQKLDRIKQEEDLIHFDCVLLEQPGNLNGLYLWITSWFYNLKNLEFLRYESDQF